MLENPNPESPLNRAAAQLMLEDRKYGTKKFAAEAQAHTKKYASKSPFS